MNYKKAIQEITERRKNDLLFGEQRLIQALRENDDLHSLDVEIRKAELKKRKGEPVDEQSLALLKKQRQEMFRKLGISETVPFRCEKCRDTGVLEGKPCACAVNLVVAATAASEALDVDFDSSNLSVFSENDRPTANHAYTVLKTFCSKFPLTNIKNILLRGGTGTGKTHLASCVANRLSGQGFSVIFVSAFGFVNRMLAYHRAPIDEKLDHLSPIIDCDLLIIDDLGTESMLKNVTAEYLYSVLNERMRLKKHTMITTNMDREILGAHYGERLSSRLYDQRISTGLVLAESDIRKL